VLPKAYLNVKAAREAGMTIRTLVGSVVPYSSSVGSFLNSNDLRIQRANLRHCSGKKANFSASFNLEKLKCNTCTFRGEHLVLHREVECTGALDESPVCFILSDQCFPPVLPVEGDGECLKILLIEDGTLDELADAFLDLTRGFSVPASSVVVMASASHLARVGTAKYAVDYVDAVRRLVGSMGGGIELTHGIPILLGGTEDSALLRSLVDLEHWLGHIGTSRDISRARRACLAHILGRDIFSDSVGGGTGMNDASVHPLSTGTPEASVHHKMKLVLPSSLANESQSVFVSNGYKLPTSVQPCSQEHERVLIDMLIEDLNRLYMTDIATEYCTARDGTGSATTSNDDILISTRFILVGASHASRLAGALRELGAEVADLSVPGWKLTEALSRTVLPCSGR
jgi:hypothetical protein